MFIEHEMFHVSPQLLAETFFTPINSWRVTPKMRPENHLCLHMKFPLLSDFRLNLIWLQISVKLPSVKLF
jgi:hypothetical protein